MNVVVSCLFVTRLQQQSELPVRGACLQSSVNDRVEACGIGFYSSGSGTSASRCQPCDETCSACSSGTVCTRCAADRWLQGGVCVVTCSNGFYSSFTGNIDRTRSLTGAQCLACDQSRRTDLGCAPDEVVTCAGGGTSNLGCGVDNSGPT